MNTTKQVSGILLGIFILVSVPNDGVAQGGGQGACGCSEQDKRDLESRINQVTAAMKEYDALIAVWETKEKGVKEPVLLNPYQRGHVQGAVNFKMAGAGDPAARRFKAETNPACETEMDPNATPCLRGALQDHEAVHQKACEANKGKASFFDLYGQIDWRVNQRVVDYMKEEKAGYQKELERLQKERTLQQKNCPKLTKMDPSMQRQLQGALAQQERLQSASNRVQSYGQSLN